MSGSTLNAFLSVDSWRILSNAFEFSFVLIDLCTASLVNIVESVACFFVFFSGFNRYDETSYNQNALTEVHDYVIK